MKRGKHVRRSIKKYDIERDRKFSKKRILTYAVVATGLGLGGIVMYNLYGNYDGGKESDTPPPAPTQESPKKTHTYNESTVQPIVQPTVQIIESKSGWRERFKKIEDFFRGTVKKISDIKEIKGDVKGYEYVKKLAEYDILFNEMKKGKDVKSDLKKLINCDKKYIDSIRSMVLKMSKDFVFEEHVDTETIYTNPGHSFEIFYEDKNAITKYGSRIGAGNNEETGLHVLAVSKETTIDKAVEELYVLNKINDLISPFTHKSFNYSVVEGKCFLNMLFSSNGNELVRLSDTEEVIKLFLIDENYDKLKNIKENYNNIDKVLQQVDDRLIIHSKEIKSKNNFFIVVKHTYCTESPVNRLYFNESSNYVEMYINFIDYINKIASKIEEMIDKKIISIRNVIKDFYEDDLNNILTDGENIFFTEYKGEKKLYNTNDKVKLNDVRHYIIDYRGTEIYKKFEGVDIKKYKLVDGSESFHDIIKRNKDGIAKYVVEYGSENAQESTIEGVLKLDEDLKLTDDAVKSLSEKDD